MCEKQLYFCCRLFEKLTQWQKSFLALLHKHNVYYSIYYSQGWFAHLFLALNAVIKCHFVKLTSSSVCCTSTVEDTAEQNKESVVVWITSQWKLLWQVSFHLTPPCTSLHFTQSFSFVNRQLWLIGALNNINFVIDCLLKSFAFVLKGLVGFLT